jgi:hypothetical protein
MSGCSGSTRTLVGVEVEAVVEGMEITGMMTARRRHPNVIVIQ